MLRARYGAETGNVNEASQIMEARRYALRRVLSSHVTRVAGTVDRDGFASADILIDDPKNGCWKPANCITR